MKGLRITGGILKRRNLKVPRQDVRPTQDMVREALFNILGESVAGARFLDLFGGSGAVGIEAWSRGAGYVCWVENNGAVLKVLSENVGQLCDEGTRILRGDVYRVLKKGVGGEEPFDIIFADPPYSQASDGSQQAAERMLKAVAEGGVIRDGGIFIMEMARKRAETAEPEGWELIDERSYGRTKLVIFRRGEQ